jgi:hypothetical protein
MCRKPPQALGLLDGLGDEQVCALRFQLTLVFALGLMTTYLDFLWTS